MAKVVFVHGVGKQYLSEDSLARDVVPELCGGARLAGGPVPAADEVRVAFYGDLFRPQGDRAGGPAYDAADVEGDDEFDLLMAWWAEAARTDADVPGPDEEGERGLAGWAASRALRLRAVRAALNALTGARFLSGVLDRALIGDLKQVTGYFTNPSARKEAQKHLAACITPDTRVVVAHSLGSVVAYQPAPSRSRRGDFSGQASLPAGNRWSRSATSAASRSATSPPARRSGQHHCRPSLRR